MYEKLNRNERQDIGIEEYRKTGNGTLAWCTGMGKTRAALIIQDKVIEKIPDASFIVIVPTTALKDQWQQLINPTYNVKVITIQSLISKKESLECRLLIVDEPCP